VSYVELGNGCMALRVDDLNPDVNAGLQIGRQSTESEGADAKADVIRGIYQGGEITLSKCPGNARYRRQASCYARYDKALDVTYRLTCRVFILRLQIDQQWFEPKLVFLCPAIDDDTDWLRSGSKWIIHELSCHDAMGEL
jgi:hypothetical protein